MKFAILIAILAFVYSQNIKLDDGEEQLEKIDNNFEDGRNVYEVPPSSLEAYRNQQRYGRESKHKLAYQPKDSKLKFRHYKQGNDDNTLGYQPYREELEKKLRNFNLMQDGFGEAELNNRFARGNRTIFKRVPEALQKRSQSNWLDERLNEGFEGADAGAGGAGDEIGDGSDGFSFKNLMPLWRPFETVRKENKALAKNSKSSNNKKKATDKQEKKKKNKVVDDNFLLMPDQEKYLLIKALNQNRNRFDNLQPGGLKIVKVNGKTDLKMELDDDHDVAAEAKKKFSTHLGKCHKQYAEEDEKIDYAATTTSTEEPPPETTMENPDGTEKPEKTAKGGGVGRPKGGQGEMDRKELELLCSELYNNISTTTTTTTAKSTTTKSTTTTTTAANFFAKTKNPTTAAPTNETEISEKDLKEEILSCTADKLEKYLKMLKNKCDNDEQRQQHHEDENEPEHDNEHDHTTKLPARKLHTVYDSIRPKTNVPIANGDNFMLSDMLRHLTEADLLRLNITINGLVMKDEKPSQIHGNATIHLKPATPKPSEERKTRGVKNPFSRKKSKNKAKEMEKEKECKDEYKEKEDQCEKPRGKPCTADAHDTDLSKDSMSSYQISNEIVKMVSQMVHSNPNMKTLWPSLKRNRPADQRKSAATIRKLCKGPGRKRLEEMIRRAMSSVDEIIEQEVQQRSCAPLSEDLQNFYELILSLHAKQAKRTEEREERLNKSENLEDECPTCAPDEKPKEPCDDNSNDEVDLNDNSLFDMIHERKLKYDNEIAAVRRSREAIRRNRDLEAETANSTLVRRLREGYSPAFLKLHEVADAMDRAVVGGGEVP